MAKHRNLSRFSSAQSRGVCATYGLILTAAFLLSGCFLSLDNLSGSKKSRFMPENDEETPLLVPYQFVSVELTDKTENVWQNSEQLLELKKSLSKLLNTGMYKTDKAYLTGELFELEQEIAENIYTTTAKLKLTAFTLDKQPIAEISTICVAEGKQMFAVYDDIIDGIKDKTFTFPAQEAKIWKKNMNECSKQLVEQLAYKITTNLVK